MEEFLKFNSLAQWELLDKARPLTPEEAAKFKANRDAWLRQKHGLPAKEEHEKQLADNRKRELPKTSMPNLSRQVDERDKELNPPNETSDAIKKRPIRMGAKVGFQPAKAPRRRSGEET